MEHRTFLSVISVLLDHVQIQESNLEGTRDIIEYSTYLNSYPRALRLVYRILTFSHVGANTDVDRPYFYAQHDLTSRSLVTNVIVAKHAGGDNAVEGLQKPLKRHMIM
jgi:hypothetical protein